METAKKVLFIGLFLVTFLPFIDPPVALFLGIIVAQTIGHPFIKWNKPVTSFLLKASIIGLGFGMNLEYAIQAGKDGILFTVFSIFLTLIVGIYLGRLLKVDRVSSTLISGGTAICGGSAIAAFGPILGAGEKQMSVSLGIVFILNSVALFVFPHIGKWLSLNQEEFGMWAAIAIHDTSSVVGAASKYGDQALMTATTVKLTRALWIIPLSLLMAITTAKDDKKIKIPFFIFLFVGALIFAYYFPQFEKVYGIISSVAKKGLTVTLFLIGTGISRKTLKSVGVNPFLQGTILWIVVSISTLFIVRLLY
ncbi:MAG: putative sulfate exporter family transporter [Flavobacteriales bacterium]|nr:putative sulfate exporter family transporter [Flavobacteriales bacterium]